MSADEPHAEPLPDHGEVWYVSYGSNMYAARLAAYLQGGRPQGGSRANPGARNRSLPRRSVPVDLPGALYFAGKSPQWGGGVAFYDHDAQGPEQGGPTAARAYLITAEQFADVAAQEMYRLPQVGDPLEEVVLGGIDGGVHRAGPGRYETLIEVGRLEGAPLLLFTSPHGIDHVEHTQPTAPYLAMLSRGLQESRQWSEDEVAAYFARLGVLTSSA